MSSYWKKFIPVKRSIYVWRKFFYASVKKYRSTVEKNSAVRYMKSFIHAGMFAT